MNVSRISVRKKKKEARSNQRDAKRTDIASIMVNEDDQNADNNIIIGSRSKEGSDVLMLGSSRPLRCLSSSCVSEKDMIDVKDGNKPSGKAAKPKARKKQHKINISKPTVTEQLRYRYIQRLKQVVFAGNSKQNQMETERKVDAKPQRYQLRSTELIWLELQSWFNDRSLADQDQILYNARQSIVKDVLNFVSSFHFEEKNFGLISTLNSQINSALDQTSEALCDCDCYLPSATISDMAQSRETKFADEVKTVFELKENAYRLENSGIAHLLIPSEKYQSLQVIALEQVGGVLKLLCIIENLYPSCSKLADEYLYYSKEEFQSKVDSICCWYNITSDLRSSFSSLVRILILSLPSSSSTLQNRELLRRAGCGSTGNSPSLGDCVTDIVHVSQLLSTYTDRALKQKSVKSILHALLVRHFTGLLRAKMSMLPKSCYEYDNLLSKTDIEGMSHQPGSPGKCAHFSLDEDGYKPSTPYQECHQCYIRLNPTARKLQQEKLGDLLKKIEGVFSLSGKKISKDRCLAILAEAAPAVSSSDRDSAVFGLPSIKPLYIFFPSTFLAVMRHCMHQRMKQAMPFFQNSGSSVCLLTAKQLVLESKEMLECAFLARDIMRFFVTDIFENDDDIAVTLLAYEKDLHNMINTYLDFVNSWLLRMQRDLPHVPRGFQEILEQEWQFSCKMSPHIDIDSVVMCSSRFIKISADIVDSAKEFLITAITELVHSQNSSAVDNDDMGYNGAQSYDCKRRATSPMIQNSDGSECPSKGRAGILWFHRQRSESPHLSRHSSMQSSDSSSPVTSPVELNRQTSSTSSSSSFSLPWLNYKHTTRSGYQKRYLFEVCRAVRELFNETRERATRILSFTKRLRKTLEPAVGYNIRNDNNFPPYEPGSCPYCCLLEILHSKRYVLVDFADATLKPWEKGASCNDYVNLDNYWILIPDPSELLKRQQHTSATGTEFDLIWSLMRCALFDHIKKHPPSDREVDDEEGSKLQCVIFIKKPDSNVELHRRSEVNFPPKRKRKNRPQKSVDGSASRRQLRTRSEISLNSQVSLDHDAECSSHHAQKETCTSMVKNAGIVKVYSKQCLDSFDTLCRHYDLSHDITIALSSAEDVGVMRKDFTGLLSSVAHLAIAQTSIVKGIKSSFDNLRVKILQLCDALMECIQYTLDCLEMQCDKILHQHPTRVGSSDIDSRRQIKSEVNEVMQSCFNFAFDFVKEATRVMSGDFRDRASEVHVKLSIQWMGYVLKHRDKGKGRRPRWASQGLTFLCSLDTSYWIKLDEKSFSQLRQKIDSFIHHLIGDPQSNPDEQRGNRESSSLGTLQIPEYEVQMLRSLSNSSAADTAPRSPVSFEEAIGNLNIDYQDEDLTPIERIRMEIEEMEETNNRQRVEARVIGRVSDTQKKNPIINLGVRTVNFRWQRGAKVGEGTFGRVYTCVNVDSGTILAMKEVKFHPNDHQKIRSAVDEYTNFEGIKHHNLVQYYGVELHRDEMYIFMEYCDGGTLADICKIGLPEAMVRKYTSQILVAINVLHARGIVHRDIKGSNVFLDSAGTIKLGDFGSAVKLKDVTKTIPGEMVTHIGTTLPYSAPEVINTSEKNGYGRASDIWSLGCVVIEMASGKQPWHDLERFQVMFRIGSGERPPIPDSLCGEVKNFIMLCTIPDALKRWTADQLLGQPFVKFLESDETI